MLCENDIGRLQWNQIYMKKNSTLFHLSEIRVTYYKKNHCNNKNETFFEQ